jgi:hypothetical protein
MAGKKDKDPTRTELSSNPADYLTGPTSGSVNTRQGGTTTGGAVSYTAPAGTGSDAAQQVAENTQAAQTEGNADTTAQAQ